MGSAAAEDDTMDANALVAGDAVADKDGWNGDGAFEEVADMNGLLDTAGTAGDSLGAPGGAAGVLNENDEEDAAALPNPPKPENLLAAGACVSHEYTLLLERAVLCAWCSLTTLARRRTSVTTGAGTGADVPPMFERRGRPFILHIG